jgi:hypothetical protein
LNSQSSSLVWLPESRRFPRHRGRYDACRIEGKWQNLSPIGSRCTIPKSCSRHKSRSSSRELIEESGTRSARPTPHLVGTHSCAIRRCTSKRRTSNIPRTRERHLPELEELRNTHNRIAQEYGPNIGPAAPDRAGVRPAIGRGRRRIARKCVPLPERVIDHRNKSQYLAA